MICFPAGIVVIVMPKSEKFAVQDFAAVMVMLVVALVPEQSPLQELKI